MGMGNCNGHKVCMSVAYKLDYAVKKALQFENASTFRASTSKISNGSIAFVKFEKVNKVKVGELEAETSYSLEELKEYIQEFTK